MKPYILSPELSLSRTLSSKFSGSTLFIKVVSLVLVSTNTKPTADSSFPTEVNPVYQ
jgi:hypothetical protein